MNWLNFIRTRSISVMHVQAGGCRGCALQFSTALSQNERIRGITMTGNPKHADVLLVSGCINEKSKARIQQIYGQMPLPKAVIAVGACSCSGSLFKKVDSGQFITEDIIPVDAWVRGCTPGLSEMIEAVVRAVECGNEKEESRDNHEQKLE